MYSGNSDPRTKMELSTDVKIKQENNCFEYEDDNKNLLDIRYDIKVECDVGLDPYLLEVPEELDWCVQNQSIAVVENSVGYEELLDYSILKCKPCCMTFTNRYQLLKHNLVHLKITIPKTSLFQCDQCSKYFLLRRKLISHIHRSHSSGSLVTKMLHRCNICSKVYRYSSWHSHMNDVHTNRQYKCEICDYSFKAKRYLKRHVIFKHQGVPRHLGITAKGDIMLDMKCELCPAVLKNKNALKTHIRNCHSDERFKCALCKIVFKSRPYLFCHLRRRHKLDEDYFECDLCHKTFKWQQMLDIHRSSCKIKIKE